jgi:hypothetical protein
VATLFLIPALGLPGSMWLAAAVAPAAGLLV